MKAKDRYIGSARETRGTGATYRTTCGTQIRRMTIPIAILSLGLILALTINHKPAKPTKTQVVPGITIHQEGEWTVYSYDEGRFAFCKLIMGRPDVKPVCIDRK